MPHFCDFVSCPHHSTAIPSRPLKYSRLQAHSRAHYDERVFQCTFIGCKASFKFHHNYLAHTRRHSGATFPCDKCATVCASKTSLNRHVQNQHFAKELFSCPMKYSGCGYTTKTRAALIVHERTHSGEGEFPCTVCNVYTARQKVHLIRHKIKSCRGPAEA